MTYEEALKEYAHKCKTAPKGMHYSKPSPTQHTEVVVEETPTPEIEHKYNNVDAIIKTIASEVYEYKPMFITAQQLQVQNQQYAYDAHKYNYSYSNEINAQSFLDTISKQTVSGSHVQVPIQQASSQGCGIGFAQANQQYQQLQQFSVPMTIQTVSEQVSNEYTQCQKMLQDVFQSNLEHQAVNGNAQNGQMAGLAAWLPQHKTSKQFFGVDQSIDPVKLGGVYYNGSNQNTEEALIDATETVHKYGGTPDTIVVSPTTYVYLQKNKLPTQYGNLNVISDPNCSDNTAYVVQSDTWQFCQTSGPQTLTHKSPDTDSYTITITQNCNLTCTNPGYNAVVDLPTQDFAPGKPKKEN